MIVMKPARILKSLTRVSLRGTRRLGSAHCSRKSSGQFVKETKLKVKWPAFLKRKPQKKKMRRKMALENMGTK